MGRQLDVAKAKEVMKGKYDEMVTAAVDAKDLPRLEELMPKLTALGASYGDLATKGNNGIKKCYIAFCEECVESKNHEKLEKELIPKIKNELKFDDLELKANQCLEEIYKLYIDGATEAKDIAKLDELIVKVNELSLESAVFYGNEKLRATFDILSREAETKNDPNLLEGDNGLIAQIKNHDKFDAQLDIAIDCLKNIYISFCKEAQNKADNVEFEEKNADRLEKELIGKFKFKKFKEALSKANDYLQQLYVESCKDAESKKDTDALEKKLIPKIESLNMQS